MHGTLLNYSARVWAHDSLICGKLLLKRALSDLNGEFRIIGR